MQNDIPDEMETLTELARIQRQALAAVRKRMAAEQLGEAFTGLDEPSTIPALTY